MKEAVKNPIVFIPGLMGSIGEEMISGTGSWRFGVAGWIYEPFIKGLEDLGYRKEDNLFICYYDWRKSAKEIEAQYLRPTLDRAKKKHPNEKIDILCHSYGGIVARCYIQGSEYKNDLQRLVMMGTPNRGSVDAYYLWSTGKLMDKEKKTFYNYLYKGYLWILSKLLNIPFGADNIDSLHELMPSLGNLIPTYDYGDFLCYKISENGYETVPRGHLKYKNQLLNSLNYRDDILRKRVLEGYCIMGSSFITNQMLIVDREKFKINQEYLNGTIKTIDGDGTVTLNSTRLDPFTNIILEESHHGILKGALKEFASIYGVEADEIQEDFTTLHIIFNGNIDFTIEAEASRVLVYKEGNVITELNYIHQIHDKNFSWIVIKNIPKGEYEINMNQVKKESFNLLIMGDGIIDEFDEEVLINKEQIITLKL
ncbi:lipase family alpha/beta hydrolase [Alkaliphilus peptidifermentans]|uniref:Lecithin:cholesterol acyltransferase n=1 Tax=Alkaliphilus peptidifermentans DSM 18978 TaxID=1120976 RepID=A0A1G5K3V1_9FIRM|nr:hypothetical protein [Alkaliphilus peptidifermentans]SCY94750.1 Lecithin:cholesterol acyltransferase [Alkaliphilus peptidifermentans DSM 18978]